MAVSARVVPRIAAGSRRASVSARSCAMALAFALEKQVAISAVLRACSLTSSVFKNLVQGETLTKGDKSPVTVADFSAQALVNVILASAFPADPIVGEEEASELRQSSSDVNMQLKSRITELANRALSTPLRSWERADWGIGSPASARTTAQLLDAIDRGSHPGGSSGRMWTLDPVDGTKGFLRGEQYAVCLALIVDSVVQVGVMGCPNLPAHGGDSGDKGFLFVAVKGQGAEQYSFAEPEVAKAIRIPACEPSQLVPLVSVEAAHSSQDFTSRITRQLGIMAPPLRMDSQAKYCSLARGEGGVYLRMPTGVGYAEKIWDHASGNVLVTEAGGLVTDSRGQPFNFGLGRTLGENWGVVACGREVHPAVLEAVKLARADQK